jgi:hypothetical protein
VGKCEGIEKDVRKIQRFREWVRSACDAGRFIPSRDAGMAPQGGGAGLTIAVSVDLL